MTETRRQATKRTGAGRWRDFGLIFRVPRTLTYPKQASSSSLSIPGARHCTHSTIQATSYSVQYTNTGLQTVLVPYKDDATDPDRTNPFHITSSQKLISLLKVARPRASNMSCNYARNWFAIVLCCIVGQPPPCGQSPVGVPPNLDYTPCVYHNESERA